MRRMPRESLLKEQHARPRWTTTKAWKSGGFIRVFGNIHSGKEGY